MDSSSRIEVPVIVSSNTEPLNHEFDGNRNNMSTAERLRMHVIEVHLGRVLTSTANDIGRHPTSITLAMQTNVSSRQAFCGIELLSARK